MNQHTTNYTNTFIAVADDCPVAAGAVPPQRSSPTLATLQYQLMAENPYRYNSDEVLFSVAAQKNGWAPEQLDEERHRLFSKGQPCLRSSPLGKSYGWGSHHDALGRVAVYPLGSPEYERLRADPSLKQLKAMKSSRSETIS